MIRLRLKKSKKVQEWNGFVLHAYHWYGTDESTGEAVVTNGFTNNDQFKLYRQSEDGTWNSEYIEVNDDSLEIVAEVEDQDVFNAHPDLTFNQYLEKYEGVTWNYFDENYSSSDVDRVTEAYEWERTGLPFFARDTYKDNNKKVEEKKMKKNVVLFDARDLFTEIRNHENGLSVLVAHRAMKAFVKNVAAGSEAIVFIPRKYQFVYNDMVTKNYPDVDIIYTDASEPATTRIKRCCGDSDDTYVFTNYGDIIDDLKDTKMHGGTMDTVDWFIHNFTKDCETATFDEFLQFWNMSYEDMVNAVVE